MCLFLHVACRLVYPSAEEKSIDRSHSAFLQLRKRGETKRISNASYWSIDLSIIWRTRTDWICGSACQELRDSTPNQSSLMCIWQSHFRPQTLLPTMSSKTQSNMGFILSPSSLASILSLYRQAFHLHNIKRKKHCFKQSEMRISFIIFLFLRSSFIYMKMKFISSNFVTYINISLD